MSALQSQPTRGATAAHPAAAESDVDPAALRALSTDDLRDLACRIREHLVAVTAVTGGHLGPNLGVVELTLALHLVLDSPREAIIWDTGHQAYVHKMLTGRWDLTGLRQRGGTSGYPSRAESPHDVVENSHASGSIAWAHGIDRGLRALGDPRVTAAVIGDGALTGGVGLEALNELADDTDTRTLVVLNDNTRSYAPTVGGIAQHLKNLRAGTVPVGYDIFTQMGLTYLGPVDGHDLSALQKVLTQARRIAADPQRGAPIVHVVTRKGMGFVRAEQHLMDHWHSTGPFPLDEQREHVDSRASRPGQGALTQRQLEEIPADGEADAPAVAPAPASTWTAVLGQTVLDQARQDPRVMAISAAMVDPVGLTPMAEEMPHRVLDVGIAEQLAMATAAGLAHAGAKPVVALYATFLNRAFDQLLLDVALHAEDVTITLDRAGVTGDDGPSHHGIWDLALAAQIPGASLRAPRDGTRLRDAVPAALAEPGVSIVRFPKGALPDDLPAVAHYEGLDVLHGNPSAPAEVLVVAIGSLAAEAVEAARDLAAQGRQILVVDPVQALPLPEGLVELASRARAVVTVEDGVRERGVGAALGQELLRRATPARPAPPLRMIGVAQGFPEHAKRDQILSDMGMDAAGIARTLREFL